MEGKNVLFFPSPFQGHITPMLHLSTLLHSKGFSITIIHTRYNSPDPTHFPHFKFHFIDDDLPIELGHPSADSLMVVRVLNKCCVQPFKDCISMIMKDDDPKGWLSCLIADPIWDFTACVVDEFKIPRISIRTSSITALLAYNSIPLLRHKGYFSTNDSKMDDPHPELPHLRVKDLPSESLHDIIETVIKETKASKGIICNSFEELEGSLLSMLGEMFPIPIFLLGPLHIFSSGSSCSNTSIWEQDTSSIPWLDKQAPKSVIYVSFGSVAAMTLAEFEEVAWGIANSNQPFLWVVRPGLVREGNAYEQLLPKGYLDEVGERGLIVKWAPQQEVLAHPAIGGFWTHCGWNSTLESICEGVPMICLPFLGDQTINSRNVSENWRVGLGVEKGVLNRDEIGKVIRRLMVEKEGEEMRNRAKDLKDKAKLCVMEGGSSYKSLESLTSYIMSL